ncbi:serine/threonine-protein kinase-like protein At1g28390 [Phalaenopsis equestris]|uniref:serine/threonine-protein kinase-like protein At1g28390 n=1 Tax=Phalaenopsis equestris TaxID=78828 RepID=UPI0009E4D510|nr:serine/threonine-protein kinase-like protein At1g28390 [Phalaenopsis equestris]
MVKSRRPPTTSPSSTSSAKAAMVVSTRPSSGGKDVFAVKKPLAASSTYLDNEIDILLSYSSRYVVNLVGLASDHTGSQLLLMEYMSNGSLEKLLQVRPDLSELTWRVAVAIQVGRGLVGLHRANPPIIHRDVKSTNILFDGKGRARLADFSLATRVGGPSRPAAGTIGYIDPRYIGPGQLGEGVDVFSFGVVVLELVGGRRVIEDRGVGEGVLGRLAAVAGRCMATEGGRRPRMEEVVEELERAAERVWWPLGVVRRWVKRRWRRKGGRRGKVVRSTTRTICNKELMDDDGDENRF